MRHRRVAAIAIGLMVVSSGLVACEESAGGDGGADASGAAAATGPTVITPDNSQPFQLAEGMYRVSWTTTGCTSITAVLEGDNGITKEKTSTIPNFSYIATGIEDGTYTLNQTDPSCAQWELEIEKIGG